MKNLGFAFFVFLIAFFIQDTEENNTTLDDSDFEVLDKNVHDNGASFLIRDKGRHFRVNIRRKRNGTDVLPESQEYNEFHTQNSPVGHVSNVHGKKINIRVHKSEAYPDSHVDKENFDVTQICGILGISEEQLQFLASKHFGLNIYESKSFGNLIIYFNNFIKLLREENAEVAALLSVIANLAKLQINKHYNNIAIRDEFCNIVCTRGEYLQNLTNEVNFDDIEDEYSFVPVEHEQNVTNEDDEHKQPVYGHDTQIDYNIINDANDQSHETSDNKFIISSSENLDVDNFHNTNYNESYLISNSTSLDQQDEINHETTRTIKVLSNEHDYTLEVINQVVDDEYNSVTYPYNQEIITQKPVEDLTQKPNINTFNENSAKEYKLIINEKIVKNGTLNIDENFTLSNENDTYYNDYTVKYETNNYSELVSTIRDSINNFESQTTDSVTESSKTESDFIDLTVKGITKAEKYNSEVHNDNSNLTESNSTIFDDDIGSETVENDEDTDSSHISINNIIFDDNVHNVVNEEHTSIKNDYYTEKPISDIYTSRAYYSQTELITDNIITEKNIFKVQTVDLNLEVNYPTQSSPVNDEAFENKTNEKSELNSFESKGSDDISNEYINVKPINNTFVEIIHENLYDSGESSTESYDFTANKSDVTTKSETVHDTTLKYTSATKSDVTTKSVNIDDDTLKYTSATKSDVTTKAENIDDNTLKYTSATKSDVTTKSEHIDDNTLKYTLATKSDVTTKNVNIDDDNTLKYISDNKSDVTTKSEHIDDNTLKYTSATKSDVTAKSENVDDDYTLKYISDNKSDVTTKSEHIDDNTLKYTLPTKSYVATQSETVQDTTLKNTENLDIIEYQTTKDNVYENGDLELKTTERSYTNFQEVNINNQTHISSHGEEDFSQNFDSIVSGETSEIDELHQYHVNTSSSLEKNKNVNRTFIDELTNSHEIYIENENSINSPEVTTYKQDNTLKTSTEINRIINEVIVDRFSENTNNINNKTTDLRAREIHNRTTLKEYEEYTNKPNDSQEPEDVDVYSTKNKSEINWENGSRYHSREENGYDNWGYEGTTVHQNREDIDEVLITDRPFNNDVSIVNRSFEEVQSLRNHSRVKNKNNQSDGDTISSEYEDYNVIVFDKKSPKSSKNIINKYEIVHKGKRNHTRNIQKHVNKGFVPKNVKAKGTKYNGSNSEDNSKYDSSEEYDYNDRSYETVQHGKHKNNHRHSKKIVSQIQVDSNNSENIDGVNGDSKDVKGENYDDENWTNEENLIKIPKLSNDTDNFNIDVSEIDEDFEEAQNDHKQKNNQPNGDVISSEYDDFSDIASNKQYPEHNEIINKKYKVIHKGKRNHINKKHKGGKTSSFHKYVKAIRTKNKGNDWEDEYNDSDEHYGYYDLSHEIVHKGKHNRHKNISGNGKVKSHRHIHTVYYDHPSDESIHEPVNKGVAKHIKVITVNPKDKFKLFSKGHKHHYQLDTYDGEEDDSSEIIVINEKNNPKGGSLHQREILKIINSYNDNKYGRRNKGINTHYGNVKNSTHYFINRNLNSTHSNFKNETRFKVKGKSHGKKRNYTRHSKRYRVRNSHKREKVPTI